MNKKGYLDGVEILIWVCIAVAFILITVIVFMSIFYTEPKCLEQKNECYYTTSTPMMVGKVMTTIIHYHPVDCYDTQATSIRQVCTRYEEKHDN